MKDLCQKLKVKLTIIVSEILENNVLNCLADRKMSSALTDINNSIIMRCIGDRVWGS